MPEATASRRGGPPESGNFDGGYVATAVQVTQYTAFARDMPPRPMVPPGGAP